MFVKDTMDVLGAPTRLGSQAVGSRPAKADAAFAKLLAAHGVVLLGKTCLPELGFNATTEPQGGTPTRNPWNTEHSSGGSSGGSAALVAAGVVPPAHGNDGGGSLRIPAACCGLFGLKPTRGRLPMNEAARKLPLDIVCEGVITRACATRRIFTPSPSATSSIANCRRSDWCYRIDRAGALFCWGDPRLGVRGEASDHACSLVAHRQRLADARGHHAQHCRLERPPTASRASAPVRARSPWQA